MIHNAIWKMLVNTKIIQFKIIISRINTIYQYIIYVSCLLMLQKKSKRTN